MQEDYNYEKELQDIRKIRYNLQEMPMDITQRLVLLNILRYKEGLKEDYLKQEKVKANSDNTALEYNESVKIGIVITMHINQAIQNAEDLEIKQKLYEIMQETYYFLARYLFEYYLVALEFGIPPEKQFLAPRTMVLNDIAKKYSLFYYRTDRPIMTVSMPQGTGKTEIGKRFLSWAIGKQPDKPNMFVSYSASIAKDKGFNGIDAIVNDEMGNFKKIFPKIKEIYRNAETMSLDYADDDRKKPHSEYSLYCVGFDGSVTGRTRAHNILFCDDLVKDIEEASNKDLMDKKWTEFNGTTRKRMQGNCKLLLNGTIFSINDPLSRTIAYYEEHEPSRLMRIKLPGLNENDESNFMYKYGFALTTKALLEDRDLMDPVSFSCLIQQEPIEREGLLFFEKEFKKFSLENYQRTDGYVRTVAAVDVAWGGEDYLSMPIVDEYSNGDCKLIDWYFINKADKTITQDAVVNKIIQYKITRIFFEANNGGDEYKDDIKRMAEEKGYKNCFYDSAKAPTTMSKTDRILARQAEIKGSNISKYRLLIPLRATIKGDKMINMALDQIFKFNQSQAKNVRAKQHDDAPDSLAMLFTNVFGIEQKMGKAISNISREDLGI